MPAGNETLSEFALIQRCLASDQAAWCQFYHAYYDPLARLIRQLLGRRANPELTEEIAARVWASLIFQNGCRLRAFDPERGGLLRYLAALARQEMLRFFRPRSRAGRHEVPLGNGQAVAPSAETLPGILWEGFLATLTRKERNFWHEYVMAPCATPPPGLSAENFRKLKQRVFKKLHDFLYRE